MKEDLKRVLRSLGIYHPLQTAYRNIINNIRLVYYRVSFQKYKGNGLICNFCGASYTKFVPEYPDEDIAEAITHNEVIAGYGENVYCPGCMSKNRERLIRAVLEHHFDIKDKSILHFSPEKMLFQYFKNQGRVTTVDTEPGFYRNIDKNISYADATNLQFDDGSFDIVVANHILEHIPNDSKAMREICRVMRPEGFAILQVPYSEKIKTTLEDLSINDPVQQAKLYGQKDHVRIYQLSDYINRLEKAGFYVQVLTPFELIRYQLHGIQKNECVVIGFKSDRKISA